MTPWTVARQAPLPMGILQARLLELIAMPPSRGSSQPRDQTLVSGIAGRFFAIRATREAHWYKVTLGKDGKRNNHMKGKTGGEDGAGGSLPSCPFIC